MGIRPPKNARVIQAFACCDVIMPEGGKARTGHLAGNPEMAPMSRTMMPPTCFDGLNLRNTYHEGVQTEKSGNFDETRFLQGLMWCNFRVLCGANLVT